LDRRPVQARTTLSDLDIFTAGYVSLEDQPCACPASPVERGVGKLWRHFFLTASAKNGVRDMGIDRLDFQMLGFYP